MKRHMLVGAVLGAALIATAAAMQAPDPAGGRRDGTLMRPEFRIDTSGGKIRIHGAIRVLRPVNSGRDHAVAVRLTISRPDGTELYSEDLSRIDYRRGHAANVTYPVNKEMDFNAGGLDVKVAAVDVADRREFTSRTTHGTPEAPAPGPKGDG
jgi:hypothetical protein